jgi:RNA polymerase sigma-70 factor (sigma-E family)
MHSEAVGCRAEPAQVGPTRRPAADPLSENRTELFQHSEQSAGDHDAEFSRYFDRRVADMRLTAYLLCGDWHQAEDITQAAFLKLYRIWPRLRHRDHIDAYVRQVVVRTFFAEKRRPWRRREQLTDAVPETMVVTRWAIEESQLLLRALAKLPPRQRAVLVLRYWNDLSVEETAAVLRCSAGTVKSHSARGRATLRQRLGTGFVGRLSLDREGT